MNADMNVENATPTQKRAEESKKRKKRAEGRPHRRLLEPVLFKRKEDVSRKLDIHKAKCTLLKERLDVYEREIELRAQE